MHKTTLTQQTEVEHKFAVGDVVTHGGEGHRRTVSEIFVDFADQDSYRWEEGSYGHVSEVDKSWTLVVEDSPTILTKTRTVLVRDRFSESVFAQETEDGERGHSLILDPEIWSDMGEPDTITVTVEPGDRLNAEEDDEEEESAIAPAIRAAVELRNGLVDGGFGEDMAEEIVRDMIRANR